jgi:preprotein translocase subunit SecY
MASGFVLSRMWLGPVINGVWGLGSGICLMLIRPVFRRRA